MTPQQIAIILILYAFVSNAICIGGAVVGWMLLRPTILISGDGYVVRIHDTVLTNFRNNHFYDMADVTTPFVFGEGNIVFPRGWTSEQGDEWVAAHLNKSP